MHLRIKGIEYSWASWLCAVGVGVALGAWAMGVGPDLLDLASACLIDDALGLLNLTFQLGLGHCPSISERKKKPSVLHIYPQKNERERERENYTNTNDALSAKRG